MNVSRETILRLEVYKSLLEKWQPKINLISSSTLSQLWKRHFEDSLQLLSYLPENPVSLVDLGSGAGFPALVLALARPHTLQVTLIESDKKKSLFLENVSRETKIPVTILTARIESIKDLKADVITARGLTSLTKLLTLSYPFFNTHSEALFLKGKGFEDEIKEAKKIWNFDLEIFPSLTDSTGKILKIKHLGRTSSYG